MGKSSASRHSYIVLRSLVRKITARHSSASLSWLFKKKKKKKKNSTNLQQSPNFALPLSATG